MPAEHDLAEFNQTVRSMCNSVASAAGYVEQQKDERGRLQEVAIELKINLANVNQDAEARKPDFKKQALDILKKQDCKNKDIWTHVNKFVGYYAQCQALNGALTSPQKDQKADESTEKDQKADDPTELTDDEMELFLDESETEEEDSQ